MSMLFGGWAREEEDYSDYEKGSSAGFTEGIHVGRKDGMEIALKIITKTHLLDDNQELRVKLWNEIKKRINE